MITFVSRDYYSHNNIEGVLQNDHTKIMFRVHIYDTLTHTQTPNMTQMKLTRG
jgi:hypothetical protein